MFDTVIKYLNKSIAEKVSLPYRTGENKTAILKNLAFAKANQGQLNHITGEVYYIAFALNKQRTLLTIHDVESLGSSNRWKNQLLQLFWLYLPVRQVKYVTVVSEYSKDELLKATGISGHKVIVVPNCVDFSNEDFKPKPEIKEQEPVLLQVGTKVNKNLPNLIKAIADLPCKLIILGKLSVVQRELLETNDIKFEQHSGISYQEVKELYYRADIVTFVSTYEGFGLPILEANALGRPVITSTTTSMPEVAGKAALLVDPFDPAAIRNAIERLIADDQLRTELVDEGFKNAQRFNPAAVAAQYEALYQKMVDEAGER